MLAGKFSLVVFLFAGAVSAQEFRATLQGTITDPSQAAIPRASVVLKKPNRHRSCHPER